MNSVAPMNKLVVYVTAGFATAPNFLDTFAAELEIRLGQAGWNRKVHTFFPYGDWTRSRARQLHEISRDLYGTRLRTAAYGGRRLAEAIDAEMNAERPDCSVLLIGHSAGGIASMHAADTLHRAGTPVCGVIQIGSPKCPVPLSMKERVLYLYAADAEGRFLDPITRLGTWGGWRSNRFGMPEWDRRKYAPGQLGRLQIVGGHADYFREWPPYERNGVTNLNQTMQAIWTWFSDVHTSNT